MAVVLLVNKKVYMRFVGTHDEYSEIKDDTIKLRMHEMGLTQRKLAEILGLSTTRMSEIITGKGEPSVKTGREISRKQNIDQAIVLGI